ncbi:hypothetical protein TRFO_25811 [Tritrichomonas foetus]|uniref:Uncharacterized protein n=1 Tax=Tritrichomonas foetus TaxID=1144522 RepID=A0A1J4K907_9EUKA|nr:hypothetical protein TRFO_25811 [Tritrichomonas foetus]|eukprot:OHT06196.1 hypothetical protein TRFO_25811 [Tritrichomonas foetus]
MSNQEANQRDDSLFQTEIANAIITSSEGGKGKGDHLNNNFDSKPETQNLSPKNIENLFENQDSIIQNENQNNSEIINKPENDQPPQQSSQNQSLSNQNQPSSDQNNSVSNQSSGASNSSHNKSENKPDINPELIEEHKISSTNQGDKLVKSDSSKTNESSTKSPETKRVRVVSFSPNDDNHSSPATTSPNGLNGSNLNRLNNMNNKREKSKETTNPEDDNSSEFAFQSDGKKTQDAFKTDFVHDSDSSFQKKDQRPKSALSTNANRSLKRYKKRISYNQEMKSIPDSIKFNEHIMRRYAIYTSPKSNKIPRAAMTKNDYNAKELTPLDELSQKLFNEEKPDEETTIEELKKAAHQLREYEREMVNRGNYVDARSASNALARTNKLIYKQENFNANKGNIEQLVAKKNELQAILDATNNDWDDIVNNHDLDTQTKIDQINLKHQEELNTFDNNIPEDLPPLFKRNSVGYLKLRSKEKYLAITKDFNGAIMLQKQADIIQIEEEEHNFAKLDSYYRLKKKRLIAAQERNLKSFKEYSNMRRSEMLTCKEASVRGIINRINNLDKQIKRECEKRNIKQNQINLDLVDDERIQLIREKEESNPISRKRAASTSLGRRSPTKSMNSSNRPKIKSPKGNSKLGSKDSSSAKLSGSRLAPLIDSNLASGEETPIHSPKLHEVVEENASKLYNSPREEPGQPNEDVVPESEFKNVEVQSIH